MTTTFTLQQPRYDVAERLAFAEEYARAHLEDGRFAAEGFFLDEVLVSRRMTHELGRTSWMSSFRIKIQYSWSHLAFSDEWDFLDTVAHETAHVLAGHKADHGPEWQKIARRLGATPEPGVSMVIPRKYEFACCGETWRWTRHIPGSWYSCPTCGVRVSEVRQNW